MFAAVGLIAMDAALVLAHDLFVLLPGKFGARVGYRLSGTAGGAILGAVLTRRLGFLVAAVTKHAVQKRTHDSCLLLRIV